MAIPNLKTFKNQKNIAAAMILIYIIIFCALNFWKYHNFGYNGLDLAIFNQTFYNSSFGRLFELTIHPPTYLADHFSPILVLLLIFYLPFRHPLTLLFLQNIAIALAAWPFYLLVKKNISAGWALFFAFAYLANPFVQNISMYEFELLYFALPLLFFAFYYYREKRFFLFLIFSGLAMLVREDVALVIFMTGFLSVLEKRPLRWVLAPLLLGGGYFFAALKIISHFNPGGGYKFLVYYSWLGSSLGEIVKNALTKPWLILFKMMQFGNLLIALGLLLPFCFLPFKKPKYLLLALPAFLQIALGAPGGSGLILKTQYSALFLPALFLAYQEGFKKLQDSPKFLKEKNFYLIVIALALIYSNVVIGPFFKTLLEIKTTGFNPVTTRIKNQFVSQVPSGAPAVASYDFLTKLSGRDQVYALNYFFIGKTQFGQTNYELPRDTKYILINFSDFLSYESGYKDNPLFQNGFAAGDDRLRQRISKDNFGVIEVFDDLAIFSSGADNKYLLYETLDKEPAINQKKNINLGNEIIFLGYNRLNQTENSLIPYQFFWQAEKKIADNYYLNLKAVKDGVILFEKIYPLAYGLYPTPEWQTGQIIQTNYWFYIPLKIIKFNPTYEMELIKIINGGLELSPSNSAVYILSKKQNLGDVIKLSE